MGPPLSSPPTLSSLSAPRDKRRPPPSSRNAPRPRPRLTRNSSPLSLPALRLPRPPPVFFRYRRSLRYLDRCCPLLIGLRSLLSDSDLSRTSSSISPYISRRLAACLSAAAVSATCLGSGASLLNDGGSTDSA